MWNRYRIEQAIDAELVAAKRYGAAFALLLFDVDHFKQINDTLGHSVGDDVLISLARMVEGSLRGCDHLGRWGGEEFVVLATHSSMEAAEGLAERLRGLVATLQVKGLGQPITVSIGVAVWQPDDSCRLSSPGPMLRCTELNIMGVTALKLLKKACSDTRYHWSSARSHKRCILAMASSAPSRLKVIYQGSLSC